MTLDNKIRIGLFDADELKVIKANKRIQKMIKQDRVFLEFSGHDCGFVHVNVKDAEAYDVLSELVI